MKPLEMHREARLELLDAVDRYEQQRPGLGGEFNDAVEAVLNQIRASPQRGWRYGDKGHRVLPTRRFPYFVFYLAEDERIWIPAIAHQKRKPDYWQHRK
jgi:toxin ParE1/3/4